MERKVKYPHAFKLEYIELVINKHYSNEYVYNVKGISKTNIQNGLVFTKPMAILVYCQSHSIDLSLKY